MVRSKCNPFRAWRAATTMISDSEQGNLIPTLPTLTTLHCAEFAGDRYATVMVLIKNAAGAPMPSDGYLG